jgi:hypothetical protein
VKKEDLTSLSHIAAVAAEHVEEMLPVLAEEVRYGPDSVRGLIGSKYVFGVSRWFSFLNTTAIRFKI